MPAEPPTQLPLWLDSQLMAYQPAVGHRPDDLVAVELWVRRWLYTDEKVTSAFDQAIGRFHSSYNAAASTEFQDAFKNLLLPLRGGNVAGVDVEPRGLNPDQSRLWGQVTERILTFLRADGLIALVDDNNLSEAIAVPFRFFVAGGPAVCRDSNHRELDEWSKVLKELQRLRIVPEGLSVQVEVSFYDRRPRGESLGLALALAYERWRAAPGIPFYSPLEVLATGRVSAGRVGQVAGTGGQAKRDPEGGVKGQLAERLAVKLFAAIDLPLDTKLAGINVVSKSSGVAWLDTKEAVFTAIRNLKLAECSAYLGEIEFSDAGIDGNDLSKQALCWGKIERLQRLITHAEPDEEKRLVAKRDRLANDLGFFKHFSQSFLDLERRHSQVFGRKRDLDRLTAWLEEAGQWLAFVTAPIGHGKSALMTGLRRRVGNTTERSVFFHYFAQNSSNSSAQTNLTPDSLYRRLTEHLYWEIGELPPKPDPTTAKEHLDTAWSMWRSNNARRSLVILVDGLDEVAGTLQPIFPLDLNPADRVRVIVSCRIGNIPPPVVKEWRDAAGEMHCFDYPLGKLPAAGLEQWIRETTPSLTDVECVTLSETLYDFTQGAALFTRYLLEDIQKELREGGSWQPLLATPLSFSEYVQRQWQILDSLALKNPHIDLGKKVIGLLLKAPAPGSLSRKEIAGILGLTAGLESLPPEVLRWLDVQHSVDASAHYFALNHLAIRLALPEQNDNSGALLLKYCNVGWPKKEPYALRFLPEYLIQLGAWDELRALIENSSFTDFQEEIFPEEPALLLGSVRRALEKATLGENLDTTAITELTLIHAELVFNLSRSHILVTDEWTEAMVLAHAEKMTRVPVQWDPAAMRMWHLLAAWLYHRKANRVQGISKRDIDVCRDNRNRHMNSFGYARQTVPNKWAGIAAVLLPDCFENNENRWLTELAWRSIPVVFWPRFVEGVARNGSYARDYCWKFIADSIATNRIPANSAIIAIAKGRILVEEAREKNWERANEIAIDELWTGADLKSAIDQVVTLGRLAKDQDNANVLDKLAKALVQRAGDKFLAPLRDLVAARLYQCAQNKERCLEHIALFEQSVGKVPELWSELAIEMLLDLPDRWISKRSLVRVGEARLLSKDVDKFHDRLEGRVGVGQAFKERPRLTKSDALRSLIGCVNPSVAIEQVLQLGEYAKQNPEENWCEIAYSLFATDGEAVARSEYLRAHERAGWLAAWSIAARLQNPNVRVRTVEGLRKFSEDRIAALKFSTMIPVSGIVNIACELADAFNKGRKDVKANAALWGKYAIDCRARAEKYWIELKGYKSAYTVEILRSWIRLAKVTIAMADRETFGKRSEELKAEWIQHVRAIASLDGNRGEAFTELLRLPNDDGEPRTRWMEPDEWDQAMAEISSLLIELPGTEVWEIAQLICRAKSTEDRARALARGLAYWAENLEPNEAASKVRLLVKHREWEREDRAGIWSNWLKLRHEQTAEDVPHAAARAITFNAGRVSGRFAKTRTELAVVLAGKYAELSDTRKDLHQFAMRELERFGGGAFAVHLWMDLAGAAHEGGQTAERDHYVEKARAIVTRVEGFTGGFLGTRILTQCNYAVGLRDIDLEQAGEILDNAGRAVHLAYTNTEKATLFCAVAEANSAIGRIPKAQGLFMLALRTIPGDKPLGVQPNILIRATTFELISGYSKALRHQLSPPAGRMEIFEEWAKFVFESKNIFEGESLRRAEFFRAKAVTEMWLQLYVRPDRSNQARYIDTWLDQIDDPERKARALRDLAVLEAQSARHDPGRIDSALLRCRELSGSVDKDDVVHRIGSAFAQNSILASKQDNAPRAHSHRMAFLRTIANSAESYTAAYIMLANLVRCFPQDSDKIHDVLRRRKVFESYASQGEDPEGESV